MNLNLSVWIGRQLKKKIIKILRIYKKNFIHEQNCSTINYDTLIPTV
jgi:hypothetical protein